MQNDNNLAGAAMAFAGVVLTLLVQVWLDRRADAREKRQEDHDDRRDNTRSRSDVDRDGLILVINELRKRNTQLEVRNVQLQVELEKCQEGHKDSI